MPERSVIVPLNRRFGKLKAVRYILECKSVKPSETRN